MAEEMSMPDQLQAVVCQQCGRGFVLTINYRDLLARWGAKVVVPVLCPTCFLKTGPVPKRRGKVKQFDPGKGHGFIATGEGEEIFFHQRQIFGGNGQEPSEGQVVWFHLAYSAKGPEALNVELRERQRMVREGPRRQGEQTRDRDDGDGRGTAQGDQLQSRDGQRR
jgi:CspA family cold shock protein